MTSASPTPSPASSRSSARSTRWRGGSNRSSLAARRRSPTSLPASRRIRASRRNWPSSKRGSATGRARCRRGDGNGAYERGHFRPRHHLSGRRRADLDRCALPDALAPEPETLGRGRAQPRRTLRGGAQDGGAGCGSGARARRGGARRHARRPAAPLRRPGDAHQGDGAPGHLGRARSAPQVPRSRRLTPMGPLSLFLNILWVVFGGLWMAIAWLIAGALMVVTIIGIPWARAAFAMAGYAFLQFGRRAMSRARHQGYDDLGTGPAGVLGNIVWLVLAGWWLALGHLAIGRLCAALTSGRDPLP